MRRQAGIWPWLTAASVVSAVLLIGLAPIAVAAVPVGDSPFGARGIRGTEQLQRKLASARTVEDIEWPSVQPRPPADPAHVTAADFNFLRIDSEVDAMAGAGLVPELRLQACARTSAGAPFWASTPVPTEVDVRTGPPCTNTSPRRMSDFYNYVYWTVRHYRDYRHPVRFFAILNEVNDAGQWPGRADAQQCRVTSGVWSCPSFDDYVSLLRTAHSAAHAANPQVVVLDSGLGSPTFGTTLARLRFEQGGRTDAAVRAGVAALNRYFAYRHPATSGPTGLYVDPTLPPTQLRAAFLVAVAQPYDPRAGQITKLGDRFYYYVTHMYLDPSLFDAVQLHSYDSIAMAPDILALMRAQMGATPKPVLCWECGTMWHLGLSTDGVTTHYEDLVADDFVSLLPKRAATLLASGVQQFLYLPVTWGAPPNMADSFKSAPLICNRATALETALCPGGGAGEPLSRVGLAFRTLATTLRGATKAEQLSVAPSPVTAIRFALPTSSVVVLWGPPGGVADLRRYGTVSGITDQYGVPVQQNPAAFPLTGLVFYATVR